MEKIAIAADTTCDLTEEILKEYDIRTVSLQVIYPNGDTYRDRREISAKKVAEDLVNEKIQTSLPIGKDIIDLLDEFYENGYTHVILSPLSSGLSGTYEFMEGLKTEYSDKMVIKVIDHKSVTTGFGYPLLMASKARKEGKSFDEIVSMLEDYGKRVEIYFAVDDLTYLQRGGRISKTSEIVANILDIKPIIKMTDEGTLEVVQKVRGIKKSMKTITDKLNKYADGREIEKAFIVHSLAPDKAETLKMFFEKTFKDQDIDLEIFELSSLLTVHTGPGLCGAGIFVK